MRKGFEKEHKALDAAYRQLGGRGATPDTVTLLVENYGRRSRFYHNHKHREYMAAPTSAALLAYLGRLDEKQVGDLNAFYRIIGNAHDSQYLEVDGALSDTADKLMSPYIEQKGGAIFIRAKLPEVVSVQLVLALFGAKPGDNLTAAREHNEFLSALAAALDMEHGGVPLQNIARVVQGVAGTIPFKPQDFMQQLDRRLKEANKRLSLGLSDEERRVSLLVTTDLANRDVASFCDTDLGAFVTGTMELIPEHIAQVREGATSQQFLSSLQWSINFFKAFADPINPRVDADHVFHQAEPGGYPGDVWYRQATEQARTNAEACMVYLKCKVVSAGLVAAVATLIGEGNTLLLEIVDGGDYDGIVQGEMAVLEDEEQRILTALTSRGHGNIGHYDIDGSPLAKIMLEKLGGAKMLELCELALGTDMAIRENARDYLTRVEAMMGRENVVAVLKALADVARDPAKGRRGESNEARAVALEILLSQ